ncbi:MAG TPA: methyltransferase domain-containing protein [Candidatus Saccharimonadales bacterium]|nr:methyltransferase domain-containing protein [Candidatus Saccharimonadales bacterium]
MKPDLLEVLQCPHCASPLTLTDDEHDEREVRQGHLSCNGRLRHFFEIKDGIVHLCTGFDHDLVKKELAYENSTYHGSPRLTDPAIISQFPRTLAELWPHTAHFGPDFAALIDRIKVREGDWVLDIGTGPCWSSRLLAQRGARVVALDINEANFYGLGTADMLFAAHDVYFERVLESMTHLPFADSSMDRITFNASFHHTPDHKQTLKECFRVLKPEGAIAMVNEEFGSLRQTVFAKKEGSDTGSHHQIPYADFDAAARQAGFQIDFFVADHVRQKLRQKLPALLSSWVVGALETVPGALKQLNSALIILTKEEGAKTPPPRPAAAAREPSMSTHE